MADGIYMAFDTEAAKLEHMVSF